MAGKSGLNLTKAEDPDAFLQHFDAIAPLKPILSEFGPAEVIGFAEGLGQKVFTGSTGRVFPTSDESVSPAAGMAGAVGKRWVSRLLRRHRWVGPLEASHMRSSCSKPPMVQGTPSRLRR